MKQASLLMIMLLTCCLTASLYAQNANSLDDMLLNTEQKPEKVERTANQDSLVNDIIRINYEKKNAHLAMMMSAIVPGAGQFYADKSSLSAYIFPIIELAIFGGIIYYDNQGDKKTKVYKKYVNEEVTLDLNGYSYTGTRYNRDFQAAVEDTLISIHSADIYDGVFFSLDANDSQHFYEDIGKYNKYVFGWADWYLTFAELSPDLEMLDPHPIFIFDNNENNPDNKWQFNESLVDSLNYKPYSALRKDYIKLRQAAEEKYRLANLLAFGIAINHIVSGFDAARMTNRLNRLYLSENRIKMQYYAAINDGHLTPMLGLKVAF
jgi:hypothetical protein